MDPTVEFIKIHHGSTVKSISIMDPTVESTTFIEQTVEFKNGGIHKHHGSNRRIHKHGSNSGIH